MKKSADLNLTSTLDGEFIFFRQLVHAQDSNDILQGLVVLKDLLGGGSNFVVLLTDL